MLAIALFNGQGAVAQTTAQPIDNDARNKEASSSTDYIVNANNVKLRTGSSTRYRVLTQLNAGQKISKLNDQGDWSQIRYQQLTGWMASQFLSPATPQKVAMETTAEPVTTAALPISNKTPAPRIKPSSAVKLSPATKLGSAIKPSTPATEVKPQTNKRGVAHTVSANDVTIRRGPSTRYINFVYLNKGHQVDVISQSKSWSQINFKAPITNQVSQGWLASRFLKKDETDTAATATQNPEDKLKTIINHAEIKLEAATNKQDKTEQAEPKKTIAEARANNTAVIAKNTKPLETYTPESPEIGLKLLDESLSCEKSRRGSVKKCALKINFRLETSDLISAVKVRCGIQLLIGISNGNPIKQSLQQETTVTIQASKHYSIRAQYQPQGNYSVDEVNLLSHRCSAIAFQHSS